MDELKKIIEQLEKRIDEFKKSKIEFIETINELTEKVNYFEVKLDDLEEKLNKIDAVNVDEVLFFLTEGERKKEVELLRNKGLESLKNLKLFSGYDKILKAPNKST